MFPSARSITDDSASYFSLLALTVLSPQFFPLANCNLLFIQSRPTPGYTGGAMLSHLLCSSP